MKAFEAIHAVWSDHAPEDMEAPAFVTRTGEDARAAILNDEVETDNPLLKLMLDAMKPGLSGDLSSES